MMTKQEARELQRDYLPNGGHVDRETVRKLVFRAAGPNEIYRCGMQSSYDPQSGPIFCGAVADYIAPLDKPTQVLCLCAYHKGRL